MIPTFKLGGSTENHDFQNHWVLGTLLICCTKTKKEDQVLPSLEKGARVELRLVA